MRVVGSSLLRYVGKGSVAVVVIEHVVAEVGHVQVEKPVIVIITDGRAHAVTHVSDAGLSGYVDEAQLPCFGEQILEQTIARFPARQRRKKKLTRRIETRALHEINIEVAIVVIVEQRNA